MNKILAHLACTAIISSISLAAVAAETFFDEESFDLNKIEALSLRMDHADISVMPGQNHELRVTLKQVLKRGEAESCLHKINSSKKGNKLDVFTKAAKPINYAGCSIQRSITLQLDQDAIQSLILAHHHGRISAEAFTPKRLVLTLAHSSLSLKNLSVETAELKIDHTHADTQKVSAKKLKVSGSHGKLNINKVESEQLLLKWSHGNVVIDESLVRRFEARQSHSNLKIKTHAGKDLSLHNAHARIVVDKSKAEVVELENSHGPIHYAGSSKELSFSNSHGSVTLVQYDPEFVSIKGNTRHGSIDLGLPEGSLCELEGAGVKNLNAKMFRDPSVCHEEEQSGVVNLRTVHGKAKLNFL